VENFETVDLDAIFLIQKGFLGCLSTAVYTVIKGKIDFFRS
jgi:hypothetical protein